MSDTNFAQYFAKHRRDAVLLHRPYPPHNRSRVNSKFGGLPRLPDHYEWPRDGDGNALHFLAQIDCADITFSTALPKRGVLFFFAHCDEEQIWNDEGWVKDPTRVIYALDAFAMTPQRSHPDDLGPIGGAYPPYSWRELIRKGEEGPRIHVEWPIQPLKIDSWPDAFFDEGSDDEASWLGRFFASLRQPRETDWQAEQAMHIAYDDAHRELRVAAYQNATGDVVNLETPINQERLSAQAIFEHAATGDAAYPFFWINIRHAALRFICAVEGEGGYPRFDDTQLPAAYGWLAKAEAQADDAIPDDSDRGAFRDWLMLWHKQQPGVKPSTFPYVDAVYSSIRANVRAWAADFTRAAKIPQHVYDAMRSCFDESARGEVRYSQMLGHAPSAQDPLHPGDPTLCLLNLCSDDGLGMTYGDAGNATFYISQRNLAKSNFADIQAEVVGH